MLGLRDCTCGLTRTCGRDDDADEDWRGVGRGPEDGVVIEGEFSEEGEVGVDPPRDLRMVLWSVLANCSAPFSSEATIVLGFGTGCFPLAVASFGATAEAEVTGRSRTRSGVCFWRMLTRCSQKSLLVRNPPLIPPLAVGAPELEPCGTSSSRDRCF